MGKQLVVKMKYQDELRKITVTGAKEEQGRLIAHNGGDKVAEFPMEKVEHYSLEDVPDFIRTDPS